MSMHDIIGMDYGSFNRLVSGIKIDIASKVYHMINMGASLYSIQNYFNTFYNTLYTNQDISYNDYLNI